MEEQDKLIALREEMNEIISYMKNSLDQVEDELSVITKFDDIRKLKVVCRNIILLGRTLQSYFEKSVYPARIVIETEKVKDEVKDFAKGMNGAVTEIRSRLLTAENESTLVPSEYKASELVSSLRKIRMIVTTIMGELETKKINQPKVSNDHNSSEEEKIEHKQPSLLNTLRKFQKSSSLSEVSRQMELDSDFEEMMSADTAISLFQKFLMKEFCEENLEFFLQISKFKQMQQGSQTQQRKFESIKATYLALNSPREVNIPGALRDAILKEKTANIDIFDRAITNVLQLLKFDAFRRFSLTEDYKKWKNFKND